ncbi:ribonuclease P protein subunit [Candidatus Woesearchaeota archaeon]|nr:ribonuclease P protein subunit [Candidatus Woesearchaeota archaeon]
MEAKNKSYVGLKGIIVNETKNTMALLVDGVEKTILKSGVTFTINQKKINGETIVKRTEDRIKSRGKKQ